MKKILIILILLYSTISFSQNQWVIYTMQNSGLPSNMVGGIIIDSINVKWITTGNGFVKLQGNTWMVYDTTNSSIPGNLCGTIQKDKENRIWMTIPDIGIACFDGQNWTEYNEENTGYTIQSCTSISIDSLNSKWVGFAGGLLKFNDTVWTRFHIGNSGIPSNSVLRIFNKGSIVWVGTTDAGVGRFDGQNWTTYNVYNSGLPSNWIYRMTNDIYNNIWFATRFGGVAKFNYPQNQWVVYNSANSGLPNNDVSTVYVDKNNVKWIGMPEDCAIFNDTSWQVFSSPFIGGVANFVKDWDGNMWVSTWGGLYVYNPNGVVGISNYDEIIPENFIIMRNYPNPFNATTNIKYQIPNNSFVTLKIYNILGKEITTLVNEKQKRGTYEVSFDGSGISSGVYFYRIQAGDFVQVKKMVLLK